MFGDLIKILGTALSIWDNAEKKKFVEKKMELEKAYYEEYNKHPALRSSAVLDHLFFELRVLALAWSATARKQDS